MKTLSLTTIFLFTACFLFATQWTVNNRTDLPVNPGQYTTIAAAVTAASVGDTILVAGSSINYGSVTIGKRVVLIGTGYNPQTQDQLTSNTGTLYLNASGTIVIGLDCIVIINNYLSNIEVLRCDIGQINFGDSLTNCIVADNIFYGVQLNFSPSIAYNNLTLTNNVFIAGASIYGTATFSYPFGVNIVHNLFLNGNYNQPLVSSSWNTPVYNLKNCNISNNIFYNTSPSTGTPNYDNTFVNNLSYAGATLPTMPSTGNVGSGNIDNTDPLFVTIFSSSANPYLDFNLDNIRLQNGSPAHNAATDGTDIGPTGGQYPIYLSSNQHLRGEPTIPVITQLNFVGNTATQPGGSLTVNVKAITVN